MKNKDSLMNEKVNADVRKFLLLRKAKQKVTKWLTDRKI